MAEKAARGSADDVRPVPDEAASDGSLLRLYRHGDQNAATLLYMRYAGPACVPWHEGIELRIAGPGQSRR